MLGKEGFLYKQGGKHKTWKHRYLIAVPGRLAYYKTKPHDTRGVFVVVAVVLTEKCPVRCRRCHNMTGGVTAVINHLTSASPHGTAVTRNRTQSITTKIRTITMTIDQQHETVISSYRWYAVCPHRRCEKKTALNDSCH